MPTAVFTDESNAYPVLLTSRKSGTEEAYLNTIKVIYENHSASTELNGKKLEAFPLRFRTRQGCLLINMVLEVLARATKQEKEIEGTQIRQEEATLLCLQMTGFSTPRNQKLLRDYRTHRRIS